MTPEPAIRLLLTPTEPEARLIVELSLATGNLVLKTVRRNAKSRR